MKEYRLRSVGVDGLWLHLDTADTVSGGSSELDVALVTPGGVPGVLDEPVVLATLGAVADGKDGVVEVGSALVGGEDTGLVGLEDVLVGLNGDSEGLGVEGSHHLGWGGWGDVNVGGNSNIGGGALVVSASASLAGAGGVWVDGLELGVVAILVVLVGAVLETTIAAVVAVLDVGAVNELLLGEAQELARGNEVSTLEGTGGGESPA